ncbi:uncharacterized protein METZ01_LOCUS236674, partial [marine metagenome]
VIQDTISILKTCTIGNFQTIIKWRNKPAYTITAK